jgi:hypothetical protein
MKRQSKDKLFAQYIENISREILESYQSNIRKYVIGRHGIYALFRKGKLYYVGLATNLRSRLRHHLKDRHADTWDSFSVYFTVNDRHLRELEALLIRISKPQGNRQVGRFKFADDMCNALKDDIQNAHNLKFKNLFCENKDIIRPQAKPRNNIKDNGRTPVLSKYVKNRFHIRMNYKGKNYIAHVRSDGSIKFAAESAELDRLQNKVFTSPSLAAKAVMKHAMNGWKCWTFERSPGEWVPLDALRKAK